MGIKKNPVDMTLRDIGQATGKVTLWGLRKAVKAGFKVVQFTEEVALTSIRKTWNKAAEEALAEQKKQANVVDITQTQVKPESEKEGK